MCAMDARWAMRSGQVLGGEGKETRAFFETGRLQIKWVTGHGSLGAWQSGTLGRARRRAAGVEGGEGGAR